MIMIKLPKRRSGIFAARVAVRPQRPVYLRWLAIALLTVLALGLSWGMYDAGRKFSGFDKKINYIRTINGLPKTFGGEEGVG